MKPNLLLLKDYPRLKKVLAFTFVALILLIGIGTNYAIESSVLQSAQEHSAQNDSVIKHQQYQQVVEKTMFLITQSDHNLEDYVQAGDLHKKEAFVKNSIAIEKNLQEVKSTYAGYIPKYLVNIFVHKAANRLQLNRDILSVYDTAGQTAAMEMINSVAYRSSFKEITFGEQELISALGIKIEQLNNKITIEKAEMVSLDRKWNMVSLIFMSLIALLVVYKMIETNRLNNTLSIAIQKGQQAQMVKDQFISNVTHELRTPLNSIIGYTNLLLKKEHAPETKQWIQSMKISGNLLMEVINDVLDYSKLESGHFQFSNETFDIKQVISNLNNVLQNRAEAKNISLHIQMDEKLPDYVSGDAKKLMQILVNLTGNSIKFTEQGSVSVAAKVLKQAGEKAWIQFTVSDTGIGIDKEKLPYVFERFYQIESKTSKKYYGTGLGLPIVKELVEMQGGEIEVFSTPGEGTQFVLLLPFTIATAVEKENEQEIIINKEKLIQKRILIVD
ncbi:MAG TPA: ATP-binding protein, partial [Lacibacter sp.]|nr:ATP-binding protein [Lacibacter sp.]